MKAKDSIFYWFEYLRDQGECTDIRVIHHKDKTVEEHILNHSEIDGLGAFFKVAKKKTDLKTKITWRSEKNIFKYIIGLLFYMKRLPFKSAKWKSFNPLWRENYWGKRPHAYSYDFLSKEESIVVKENAKKANVTLNSYLLHALDRSIGEYRESNSQRVWLIPVSLRSSISETSMKNEVGFVDGYLGDDIDAVALNHQIKKSLNRWEHLGGALGMSLGVILGKRLLKGLVWLSLKTQNRTGVFTNLGEASDPERSNEKFAGFPPVIESQPVGALAGTWCHEIVLALHFHPCLGLDKEEAENSLKRWKDLALGL